jgi:hypothetical protein
MHWTRVEGSPTDITAVALDGAEMWCGTSNDGVWQRDRTGKWVHHREPGDPLDNNVTDVAFIGSEAFMAGDSGISAVDLATGKWRYWGAKDGLLPGRIETLAADGDELWYVAVRGGDEENEQPQRTLASLTTRTGKLSASRIPGVVTVAVARPGLLLLAFQDRLEVYDVAKGARRTVTRLDVYERNENTEKPVLAADWPRVWFGISKPVKRGRITFSGAALMQYDDRDSGCRELAAISEGYGLSSILREGDSLWVSSFGGMPEVVRCSLAKVKCEAARNLEAAWVTSLAWTRPYLWVGTAYYEGERHGLVRYQPDTRTNLVYGVLDGLPSADINRLVIHNKQLWILTPGGVAFLGAATDTGGLVTRR